MKSKSKTRLWGAPSYLRDLSIHILVSMNVSFYIWGHISSFLLFFFFFHYVFIGVKLEMYRTIESISL